VGHDRRGAEQAKPRPFRGVGAMTCDLWRGLRPWSDLRSSSWVRSGAKTQPGVRGQVPKLFATPFRHCILPCQKEDRHGAMSPAAREETGLGWLALVSAMADMLDVVHTRVNGVAGQERTVSTDTDTDAKPALVPWSVQQATKALRVTAVFYAVQALVVLSGVQLLTVAYLPVPNADGVHRRRADGYATLRHCMYALGHVASADKQSSVPGWSPRSAAPEGRQAGDDL